MKNDYKYRVVYRANGKGEKHTDSFKERQEMMDFIRKLKPQDSIVTIKERDWTALGIEEAADLLRRAGRPV